MVVELTEDEFKEKVCDLETNTLKSDEKIVVDFYASTCGPCRVFGKLFEQFSDNYTDWTFYKVCVDDADDIMTFYKLRSMPTVLAIKNGEQHTYPSVHSAEILNTILTHTED